jgi:hypothetical protein
MKARANRDGADVEVCRPLEIDMGIPDDPDRMCTGM